MSESSRARFEYAIDVHPLLPPLGDHRFVATLRYLLRRSEGRVEKLASPVGEAWGAIEDEARRKLRDALEAWIAARP